MLHYGYRATKAKSCFLRFQQTEPKHHSIPQHIHIVLPDHFASRRLRTTPHKHSPQHSPHWSHFRHRVVHPIGLKATFVDLAAARGARYEERMPTNQRFGLMVWRNAYCRRGGDLLDQVLLIKKYHMFLPTDGRRSTIFPSPFWKRHYSKRRNKRSIVSLLRNN